MLGGEDVLRGVGLGDARVAEQADAGPRGRGHDVAVLGDPLSRLGAGDEQHGLGALERGVERGAVGVVGDRGAHTEVGERGEAIGVAAGGHDVGRRDAAVDQALDDEAAQVAGGSGDDDAHGGSFRGAAQWRGPWGEVRDGVARANRVGVAILPES